MIQALGQRVVDICIMVLVRLFNSLAVSAVVVVVSVHTIYLFSCFFLYCAFDDFVILSQMCLIIA